MDDEAKNWTNKEILDEVFTNVLADTRGQVFHERWKHILSEALEDESGYRLTQVLINLQLGSILSLISYLDGAVGPSIWPGVMLVNAETCEPLSDDFSFDFADLYCEILYGDE